MSAYSDLVALTTLAAGDLFSVVDVSDTTQAGTGSTKKITLTNLIAGFSLSTLATTTPGTGVASALAANIGNSGSIIVNAGALGTPSSGTVTNLTGTASININGTVGATTPAAGTFTTFTGRQTRRAPAVTQSATPAINTDVTDVAHITALAQAITSMTSSLTGTPVQGDHLDIDITDNGTARAITWGASFENGAATLPTTTVLSTRLDVNFRWNTVTSKWRCMAAG